MSATLAMLLWLPGAALATGGAWQASGNGPAIGNRGVQAASSPLSPPQPVTGNITEIFWRYTLTGPMPTGLQVKLCSGMRCAAIEGASGVTRGLTNVSAGDSLRFVFYVEGKGRLFPVFRVLSNQVMVNYQ